jgi:8-oxo-dGTP pyrophosphatase MutT (NUDIX family)
MIQKPRLAATVILLRPVPSGFEVLLTRRAESMKFLGGLYCFPGGAVRQDDVSELILRRYAGIMPEDRERTIGAGFSPRQALGLRIAAIRELFEETGILLAVDGSGARALPANDRSAVETRHTDTHSFDQAMDFLALLEAEGLFCDLSALTYFSHWQTPASEPVRFDTHFFLACAPAGQAAVPASSEVTQIVWLSPDAALRSFGNTELPMIFPTFASLRTLADFDSLESLLKEYRPSDPKR